MKKRILLAVFGSFLELPRPQTTVALTSGNRLLFFQPAVYLPLSQNEESWPIFAGLPGSTTSISTLL